MGIHVASVIREMTEWLSIQTPVIRVFMSATRTEASLTIKYSNTRNTGIHIHYGQFSNFITIIQTPVIRVFMLNVEVVVESHQTFKHP